jgi:hypothetical protein
MKQPKVILIRSIVISFHYVLKAPDVITTSIFESNTAASITLPLQGVESSSVISNDTVANSSKLQSVSKDGNRNSTLNSCKLR